MHKKQLEESRNIWIVGTMIFGCIAISLFLAFFIFPKDTRIYEYGFKDGQISCTKEYNNTIELSFPEDFDMNTPFVLLENICYNSKTDESPELKICLKHNYQTGRVEYEIIRPDSIIP